MAAGGPRGLLPLAQAFVYMSQGFLLGLESGTISSWVDDMSVLMVAATT